jgi:hypothetical protein
VCQEILQHYHVTILVYKYKATQMMTTAIEAMEAMEAMEKTHHQENFQDIYVTHHKHELKKL